NGTRVDGRRMEKGSTRRLLPGNIIGVGEAEFELESFSRVGSRENVWEDHVALIMVEHEERGIEVPPFRVDPEAKGKMLLGRQDSKADGPSVRFEGSDRIILNLPDMEISRKHALLRFDSSGDLLVQDCGSYHGTYVNGRELKKARKLEEGDTIKIGDYSIQVFAVKRAHDSSAFTQDGENPMASEIFMRNGKFSGLDPEMLERLGYMEAAIRLLPGNVSGRALEIWKRKMGEVLGDIPFGELCPGERLVVYERKMRAMEHVVGTACCSRDSAAYFEFIGRLERFEEFAMISRRFAGRNSLDVEYKKVNLDKKLLRALKKAKAHKIKDLQDGLRALLSAVPDDYLNGESRQELEEQLSSFSKTTRGKAIGTLNELLSPYGVVVWEHEDRAVLGEVTHMIDAKEGRSLIVKKMGRFPDIFSMDGQKYAHGLYSPSKGTILISWDKDNEMDSTHHHEVQHYIDDVVGYMKHTHRKHPSFEAEALGEATAFAAQYAYFDIPDEEVISRLKKRSLGSGPHAVPEVSSGSGYGIPACSPRRRCWRTWTPST
ncbi:TPA: FHA domain-containing protein, partial [Candidatus Micrarchaeota archaeon]|nr:FHA domain-containing protein [Candidatus Micrarchaeota archaeon]